MPFISEGQLLKLKKSLKEKNVLSHEILMFQQVMEGLRRGLTQESLFKLIVHSVRKSLGFKRCGIFLLEPGGRYMKLALGIDKNGHLEKNKERLALYGPRSHKFFRNLVEGRQKHFHTNKSVSQQYQYRVSVMNNAVVPIQVGKGRIIGALSVDNLDSYRFISHSDVSMLMNYATQVGLTIQSMKTQAQIASMASTDPLTGLYNRRTFDETLSNEVKRCRRYGRAFSLILADVDYFKSVNDTYGHDAGDSVLKWLASLLSHNLRNIDLVARVGGEEFGLLLPETPPNGISVVTRRLLTSVRESFPPVPAMARDKRHITVSLGICSYRKGSATTQQVYKLADKSLYQAKRDGRNRAGRIIRIENKGEK